MWKGYIGLASRGCLPASLRANVAYYTLPNWWIIMQRRPLRKEASQAPERDDPGHGRTPTHTRPQTPATTTGTTATRPGTHRRAEAILDVNVEQAQPFSEGGQGCG